MHSAVTPAEGAEVQRKKDQKAIHCVALSSAGANKCRETVPRVVSVYPPPTTIILVL